MIYGIGVDIVEVSRFTSKTSIDLQNLANRVLTKIEYEEFVKSKNQAVFLAKKFAAKEAFAKALGTGIGELLSFQDLSISHDNIGKPIIVMHKAKFDNLNAHISISDTAENVIAFVVIEK